MNRACRSLESGRDSILGLSVVAFLLRLSCLRTLVLQMRNLLPRSDGDDAGTWSELEKRIRWYWGYRSTSWRMDETVQRAAAEIVALSLPIVGLHNNAGIIP